ncbi:unnamed protein product, partial [Musa acuminata subsp. burmannicoides]
CYWTAGGESRQYIFWREEVMDLKVALVVVLWLSMGARGGDVTYDGRALMINGTRRLLFSGSIHYPRSTPEVLFHRVLHLPSVSPL